MICQEYANGYRLLINREESGERRDQNAKCRFILLMLRSELERYKVGKLKD